MRWPMAAVGAALAGSMMIAPFAPAQAAPQRPGPGGPYNTRHLTMSQYSMMLINGPLSGAAFGMRVGDQNIDGGIFLTRSEPLRPDIPVTLGFYGGAVIGLFPNFEVGALFIPAEVVGADNFQVQTVPVILTYSLTLGDVDIGARFTFHLGAPPKLLPGIPVRARFGRTRLDTGLFPSVRFLSDTEGGTLAGFNVPIRVAYNLTPHWFIGGESGFAEPAFTNDHDEVVPFGVVGGWTFLWGSRVIDITTSFLWDNFLFLDPASGQNALQPGFFRANIGLNIQQQVL